MPIQGERAPVSGLKLYLTHLNTTSGKVTQGFVKSSNVTKIQWAASINRGYVAVATIIDQLIQVFESIDATGIKKGNILEEYMKFGKKEPFFMRFKLIHSISDEKKFNETKWVNCIIDSIIPRYVDGFTQFIVTAIDPVTWFLKRNPIKGAAFKGTLKQYYEWLIDESNKNMQGISSKVELHMQDTTDKRDTIWYTFRKSPLDNIRSSLFLGNTFSKSRSPYIITVDQCYGDKGPSNFGIYIRDQEELKITADKILKTTTRDLKISFGSERHGIDSEDVAYEGICDNWQGYSQPRLLSTNISSTTGDFIEDPNYTNINHTKVDVLDTKTKEEESFAISKNIYGTYIPPISEAYDGSWGNYKHYISSVAKQTFADITKSTMRIKLTLHGRPIICEPKLLGSFPIRFSYKLGSDKFFLNGLWIMYAFEHVRIHKKMNTCLYLYRLDFDYNSKYTVKE